MAMSSDRGATAAGGSCEVRLTRAVSAAIAAAAHEEITASVPSFTTFRHWTEANGVSAEDVAVKVDVQEVRHCRAGVAFPKFLTVYIIADWWLEHRPGREAQARASLILPPRRTIETLHFLLRDHLGDDPRRILEGSSFQLQSVLVRDDPFCLECYPQTMVTFGCSIAFAAPLWRRPAQSWARAAAGEIELPSGPVVVLGLGGAVLSRCLAAALPSVDVITVEIERAVIDVCDAEGLLPQPPRQVSARRQPAHSRQKVVIGDAFEVLPSLPTNCSLVFLDCFDPLAATMIHAEQLLTLCRDRLAPEGVLVVNAHVRCVSTDTPAVEPFVKVFGPGAVHAAAVGGYDQTIFACLRTPIETVGAGTSPGESASAGGASGPGARQIGVKQLRAVCEAVNEEMLLNGLRLDAELLFASRVARLGPDAAVPNGEWRLWLTK